MARIANCSDHRRRELVRRTLNPEPARRAAADAERSSLETRWVVARSRHARPGVVVILCLFEVLSTSCGTYEYGRDNTATVNPKKATPAEIAGTLDPFLVDDGPPRIGLYGSSVITLSDSEKSSLVLDVINRCRVYSLRDPDREDSTRSRTWWKTLPLVARMTVDLTLHQSWSEEQDKLVDSITSFMSCSPDSTAAALGMDLEPRSRMVALIDWYASKCTDPESLPKMLNCYAYGPFVPEYSSHPKNPIAISSLRVSDQLEVRLETTETRDRCLSMYRSETRLWSLDLLAKTGEDALDDASMKLTRVRDIGPLGHIIYLRSWMSFALFVRKDGSVLFYYKK